MKFLGIILVFFGYVFVYASTAAGGRFATEPWAGLFGDAYTDAELSQMLAQVVANPGRYAMLTPAPPAQAPQQTPTVPRHGGTF